MKSLWIEETFKYDGTQLRSLFAYLKYGILGDSIVSWVGPCDVSLDHMVDGEDKRANARICGSKMLHFIIEKFDVNLLGAVFLQRLLAASAYELLLQSSPALQPSKLTWKREGDDLYWGDGKLSISIATASPTSTLIHFALNISNEGTPVPTASLEDLKVIPQDFALRLMDLFCREVATSVAATQKVHWVK